MKNFEILKLLKLYEQNSTCKKRQVAALLLEDGQVINHGTNQVVLPTNPRNCVNCDKGGNVVYDKLGVSYTMPCPAIHAEVACLTTYPICWSKDYALVVSYSPCPECCKLLCYTKGIHRVYVAEPRYKPISTNEQLMWLTPQQIPPVDMDNYDTLAKRLLNAAGIEYIRLWECPSDMEVN